MPFHPRPRAIVLTVLLCAALPILPAAATSASTSRGQVSVTQARAMLEQAAGNPTARQVLTAYLAGIGETAGTMIDAEKQQATQVLACKGRLSLDDKSALQALETSAPNAALWAETAATPLILRDMLKRANCRLPQ
ncbi:chlorophyllide reductase [Bradyrhizobium prioriisuperbiae]|uniref:chlorophyllide reductase n=1 Tax=Bradyrhizobium prioriisuperbiae TaxID=2854389 RepID=UPI0028EEEEC9|nr:chlorophyllide reductase [Bradyrhizobium prioritasuperba]